MKISGHSWGFAASKNNLFYRALSIALSAGLVISLSTPREARAQDGQMIGMLVGGLGVGMIMLSTVDSIASAQDCATQTAWLEFQKCPMLAIGVAGVVAGVATMMSGTEEASAVRNNAGGKGNNYDRTFDPTKPIAPQICQGENSASPACDCSGPNASVNILCGPDSIKNVKKILDDSRQKFADGLLPLPEGMSADDFNAQNSQADSMLDELLAGNLGAIEASSLGQATGGKKVGSEVIGGGADAVALGLDKIKAGPADRSGLGKISYANGLDLIDEASGKFLTIWQRNTRRHQGDLRGSRGFFLAKVEFMRKRALAPATLAAAPSSKAPGASKSPSVQKAAPASARKPASVPQNMGIKH